MVITVGNVKTIVIADENYAALFEKKTGKYLYQIYESTYERLLMRVYLCSRIFN